MKKRILSMLVLLLGVVAGTWAQTRYCIIFTYQNGGSKKVTNVTLPYENWIISDMNFYYDGIRGSSISGGDGKVTIQNSGKGKLRISDYFSGNATVDMTYYIVDDYGGGDVEGSTQFQISMEYATVAVTGVTLNEPSASLTVDDKVALTATVAPNDATDKTVKWSVTSGSDKVKLYTDETCETEVGTDATSALTVYAKGLSAGEATVKVESNADATKSATCAVTVNAATLAVTLTDGNDLSGLSAYAGQTVNVTYTREFTSGKTSTVCLPFAYAKKAADGSFYAFTNIEKVGSEYVATMTEPAATTLTANTPYLFTPAASSVTFTGTIADVPATFTAGETTSNGWTFKGAYSTIEWASAPATPTYGFSAGDANDGIKQGQFVKVGSYVRIQPMRCYLENASFAGARGMKREAEPLPETIKVRLIGADGEVTAIGTMQTKTGEVTLDGEAWYSMDGRRIVGKPSTKGIYVNNGHKMIIN